MNMISARLLSFVYMLFPCVVLAGDSMISLAGDWRFSLDGKNIGLGEKWHARTLDDSVVLPGTTDTNQKGTKTNHRPADRLARKWTWIGPAWYQRDVVIPEAWDGRHIRLFFERTKNSRVWIGDTLVGGHDSISAPHVFDVSSLMKPGKHTITVLIDNSKLPPVGPSHQVDERTQTNWNGIVGRMELQATDPVWIEDVQVYPNAAEKSARVRVVVGNMTGKTAKGSLELAAESFNTAKPAKLKSHKVDVSAEGKRSVIEFTYHPGPDAPLWDEFDPALIRLSLDLGTRAGDSDFSNKIVTRFGLRDFRREGNRLLLNGRPVYLRGRIDCANFPLTGYAPMDRQEWLRLLKIHKDWGLNHIRYHSWCPPAAAFEAADELGLLLQPELPNKRSAFNAPDNADAAWHNIDFMEVDTVDSNVSLYEYAKREGGLIFRHYGNSPSFVLFTLGNELGQNQGMFDMVAHYQKIDPRRLYAQGSNNMHWNPKLPAGDDFWVMGKLNKKDKPLRGSFSYHDFPNPHIEKRPPSTMVDFAHTIKGVPVPMIAHETGQFLISPDFREIDKFTGVLEARNYQLFRDRLEAAGMLDQAHDFFTASGALAGVCYREDVEAALRTRNLGGFQLLDLQDFPGQGTALVGLLNVFMESKGIMNPEEWREFCSETVPLFRMPKFTWTEDEMFSGKIQIAHYGPADFRDVVVTATMKDEKNNVVDQIRLDVAHIPTGALTEIGDYTYAAGFLPKQSNRAYKLTLVLEIEGTAYRNRYPVWIYPTKVDTSTPDGILITRDFLHGDTQDHLQAGGRVLLIPDLGKLPHSVAGQFQNEFWSPMFTQSARRRDILAPPGTLGLLCDPSHAVFAQFPTSFHTDWQWWHLVRNSRPLILDRTPADYKPLVQMIDSFERNHKLGLLMETRVGKGSLMVCAINLPQIMNHPEARQFQHSLLQYMASDKFAPQHELDLGLLKTLLPE